MPDQTCSEKLAHYAAELCFEQIPSDIVDAAKLHILDSLGCIIAGSRLEPGRRAHRLAVATSGDHAQSASTLLGTVEKASYLAAVQAMSTAAHCGELDDIHGGAGTCIGAMVVPALLSMAEKHGGGGKRFLEGAIVGYETIARIGLSIDAPKLFARGWWPSTVCGAFGVVAAGAKLSGWPAEKSANALGVAALLAGGMLTGGQEGATARHLAFGRAAQNGILALLATEQGLTGPRYAFEDPRGFCFTLCAAPKLKFLQNFETFHLPDVAFKPYPCARQLHAAVEALLKIMGRTAPPPGAIEALELFLPTQNAAMMNRPQFSSQGASHAATVGSGQYVMAVTALRGRIDLASFDEEYLHSEPVRQLTAKVAVIASTDLDRHFPKYWPGRVTVKLTGGREHTEEIIVPKGERENPMTRQDVEEKFLSLAGPVVDDANAREIILQVALLDSQKSMEPLLEALKVSE